MTSNLKIAIEGEDLVIRIQGFRAADSGASASGKTRVVASTKGNSQVAEDAKGQAIYLGLNAYKYSAPR